MVCKIKSCSIKANTKKVFCKHHYHNNEIKTVDNICYITAFYKNREFTACFDLEFLKEVKAYKWFIYHNKNLKGYGYYVVTSKKSRGSGLLWLHQMVLPVTKGYEIDHINRDTMNCLKTNLRAVTSQQNKLNRGKQSNNTSGFIGVSWYKRDQKWRAYVKKDKKFKHVGLFASKKAAAIARDAAMLELFPNEKIELNFPIKGKI